MPELAHQPGDHGRGPAAAPVPERRRPVPVRLGAGAGPPAGGSWPRARGGPGARWAAAGGGYGGGARSRQPGGIMAEGPRRPRFPSGGGRCRCGWMPELAHQSGDHGRGPAAAPVPERRM